MENTDCQSLTAFEETASAWLNGQTDIVAGFKSVAVVRVVQSSTQVPSMSSDTDTDTTETETETFESNPLLNQQPNLKHPRPTPNRSNHGSPWSETQLITWSLYDWRSEKRLSVSVSDDGISSNCT